MAKIHKNNSKEKKNRKLLLISTFIISLCLICLGPTWNKIDSGIIEHNLTNSIFSQINEYFIKPIFGISVVTLLYYKRDSYIQRTKSTPYMYIGMIMLFLGIYFSVGFVLLKVFPPLPKAIGLYVMRNGEINTLWWIFSTLLILHGKKKTE